MVDDVIYSICNEIKMGIHLLWRLFSYIKHNLTGSNMIYNTTKGLYYCRFKRAFGSLNELIPYQLNYRSIFNSEFKKKIC